MKNIRFEENEVLRLPPEVQRKRLERVIREELTEKQRQTLIAYYFQEMDIPEIAAQRGVCKSTVSRTLRRAEAKLKRYLKY